MLPARPEMNRTHIKDDTPEVRPGSWWRLADEGHEWMQREMPDHGLVLMVQEARIVDGDLHTVILHPHPIWQHSGKRHNCRLLTEDFLKAFRPEPQGDALREAEIALVMGRVQQISVEISTPPAPMLLLERQKEKKAAEADASGKAADTLGSRDSGAKPKPAAGTVVPAALLASQDIVAAQEMIETRIAAFEAQKNWITEKTTRLQQEMGLVSTYQSEKVNTALAGISQETQRAKGLLENVQTMRLFLGEDMVVTPLREGKSADPSEPLTFMQRMLYLDEEVYVHDVVEGFDGGMMGDLAQLLQGDMALVKRMLPYERSIAITRARRKSRELDIPDGSTVATIIRAIFVHMAIAQADMRIQILVRDGERVSMITCDEATSHAERLFPSRKEIDALFQTNSYSNAREITPHDLDYTDARARHDTRALFYKRFLLILWGVHERTDVFGDFAPKGSNWLDATIHSDRFRFIHDEEEVLEDGRPSIHEYFNSQNDRMRAGSRVLVDWYRAADTGTAPGVARYENSHTVFNGGFVNDREITTVFAEDGHLKARAPFIKGQWDWERSGRKPVMTRVSMRMPVSENNRPDRLYDTRNTSGFICLDNLTLAEIDYYINSRKARKDYAKFMRIFNEARIFIRDEEKRAAGILAEMTPNADSTQVQIFARALRLWREGNKWDWPDTVKQKTAIVRLVKCLTRPQDMEALGQAHDRVLRIEVKANGEVAVITDGQARMLEGGVPLPWLTEITYGGATSKKAKSEKTISFFDLDEIGRLTIKEDKALHEEVVARLTREVEIVPHYRSDAKPQKVRNWLVPRAFANPLTQRAFERIAGNGEAVASWSRILKGEDLETLRSWMNDTYLGYKTRNGNQVALPEHTVDLGVLYGFDKEDMPRCWTLSLAGKAPQIMLGLGRRDEAMTWADRLYAHPGQVVDRWESWLRNKGSAWSLQVRSLGADPSVDQMIKEGVYLSFDQDETLDHYSLPKDEHLTWREKAARLITPLVRDGWDSKWEAGDLRANTGRLHFIGAPGAEDLCGIVETGRI